MQHTCKNCGNLFTGKYCNNCGEKVYTPKDKNLAHVLEEGLHFITHFEGTLFTTLKTMFTAPGKYSLDYTSGIRKKYFKPVSLFFLLVVLYLLFPLFEGLNMQLKYYESNFIFGEFIHAKVQRLLAEKHMTYDEFSEAFHHAGEKTSKFLLFLIVPVMAFVSRIILYKKKNFYFDHIIFSLEVCSFFILWGFLFLPLITIIVWYIFHKQLFTKDAYSGLAIFLVFIPYLLIATRRFFSLGWVWSIIFTLLYTFVMALFIQTLYKFILFMISISIV